MPAISQLSDPSIYSNIKAPEAMSLADMVNLSRTSLALKKEKELYEPSVEAAKATSQSAQVAVKKATAGLATDFADKMRQQQIALINHPDIVRAEQDPQFAAANKDKIAKLVNGQAKAAEDLGLDPTKASELNAPYLEAVNQTNGQGLRQFLKTRMIAGLDQSAQAKINPNEYFQAAPVGGQNAPTTGAPTSSEPFSQPEDQRGDLANSLLAHRRPRQVSRKELGLDGKAELSRALGKRRQQQSSRHQIGGRTPGPEQGQQRDDSLLKYRMAKV